MAAFNLITRTLKYTILLLLAALTLANATPPLSEGLPEILPDNFLIAEKFVPFSQAPTIMHAPIAAGLKINDQAISPTDLASMAAVFDESFYAILPQGQAIEIKNQAPAPNTWDYPTGTTVIHQILFKTQPKKVFEVRLERKMANGTWAFGNYTQGAKGLELNHYPGLRAEQYSLTLETGKFVKVEVGHMNLQSCRACHYMNSPSKYQYPNLDSAGPCGFGPAHSQLTTDWAQRYFQIHRENPFH